MASQTDFTKGIKICIESLDKDVTNAIFWALNALSMSREGSEILIQSEFVKSLKEFIENNLKETKDSNFSSNFVNQLL